MATFLREYIFNLETTERVTSVKSIISTKKLHNYREIYIIKTLHVKKYLSCIIYYLFPYYNLQLTYILKIWKNM